MVNKEQKIDPQLLVELLKDQDPQSVLTSEELLGDLGWALAERMLEAEMDVHLRSKQGSRRVIIATVTVANGY